jgi:glucose/mannose transport system substrate-binding protein
LKLIVAIGVARRFTKIKYKFKGSVRMRSKKQGLVSILLVLTLLVGTTMSIQAAELWHYWLTGGEKAAMDALLDAARELYPESEFTERGIPGATAEVRRQLGAAFMAGDPPEVYQSAIGYDLKTYVDADRLTPLDEVWEAINGDEIFDDGLKSMVKFDGHAYAIPLNTHVISHFFYNKHIFEELDLDIPTDWDEFNEVARILRENGIEPVASSAGAWGTYQYYASLLSVVGVEGYLALGRGELAFTDPLIRESFELYRDTMVEAYMEGWAGYGWAEAANEMIQGNAAMYLNGDWVVAHFTEAGLVEDVDFGFFPAPGTQDIVIIQVDALAAPVGSPDPVGAKHLMEVAGRIEGQAAFNAHKGSVAANLDVSPDIYGPVLRGVYDRIQHVSESGTVLPNLLFMLPPHLYQELTRQVEIYTLDPSDSTLDSVLNTLETIRQEILQEDAFVSW